jgi:hypothetical protein
MSENKPKIDLKSRLKAKTVGAQGGPAIPPPVGIPKPAVPGVTTTTRRPPAPKIDASDPYSAVAAGTLAAKSEPQAIKIEMSEEVIQAQKKGKMRVVAIALVSAAVAGLLGYALGDRTASNKGAVQAVEGAQALGKEIADANAKVTELAEVLKGAKDRLRENKFPEAEISKLGAINIPFSGENMVGRGIGRFNPRTLTLLIQYANGVQEANDQKQKLQYALSGSKKALLDYLEQQDPAKRKVRWALYVGNGPHGPWASMEPLDPEQWFLASSKEKQKDAAGKETDYAWPGKLKVNEGGKVIELDRYTSGDPTGSTPKIIPVDPGTHTAVCPEGVVARLGSEITRMETVLRGDSTPGVDKQGLITLGETVIDELKKIGQP